MATPIAFESAWEKEAKKKEIRKAREHVLAKAKADYEKQERKKELAKQRGEDTWMLPSVNDRIAQEEKEIKKVKHKKHKKEKKKHKKEKKKKTKKNETSDDSDSDSDEGTQWVEKSSVKPGTEPVVQGPTLQRDDWMSTPPSYFPCVSRDELRDKKRKEKEKEDEVKKLMEKPGMHARELNPYWKDGGKGLPEQDPSKKKTTSAMSGMLGTGDCGVGWWRKAKVRCEEQAKEEGRTLEDVAADRYGSLEKLQSMLDEAEGALRFKKFGIRAGPENWRRRENAAPSNRRCDDVDKGGMMSGERSRDRDSERSGRLERNRSRDRSEERYKANRERDRSRERSGDREREGRQERPRSRDRSEERYRRRSRERDRSRDRSRRSRSRSGERDLDSRGKSKSVQGKLKSLSSRFMRPNEDDSYSRYRFSDKPDNRDSSGWKKKGFRKPGEDNETRSSLDTTEEDYRRSSSKYHTSGRKFVKPEETASSTSGEKYHGHKDERSSRVPA